MPTNRQLPSTPLTDALEALADALEAAGIDPRVVETSLPLSDWQHLARSLDNERGDAVSDIGKIEVGGVRYLIRYVAKGR